MPFVIRFAIVLPLATLLASTGCSFSRSSESISKSIFSPLTSSSASSKSDETRFREDVEEYAAAFAKGGGGDADSFRKGLSDLARKRDISDWEAQSATWRSVGRGLGRTKVSDAEAMGYARSWAGGDEARVALIRQGFDAVR